MQTEIKFETLKSKAKMQIWGQAAERAGLSSSNIGWLNTGAFEALAHIAVNQNQYRFEERPALAAFAQAFQLKMGASRNDILASYAKSVALRDFTLGESATELALIALKAREEAVEIIHRWDVRRVAKLIDLFPDIVPQKLRKATLSCYMADTEDCDWMVCFDTFHHRQEPLDEHLSYVTRGFAPA